MRRDDYKIRILFEAGIQELAINHIVLQNKGTVAISFTWKVKQESFFILCM